MSSVEQFFPIGTSYITWEEWNGSFLLFYGEELVPFNEEAQWKETALNIISLPTFSVYGLPDPAFYDKWQDWAEQLTLLINGPSR
jgi:hypothetical protein